VLAAAISFVPSADDATETFDPPPGEPPGTAQFEAQVVAKSVEVDTLAPFVATKRVPSEDNARENQ
jgi:hypothetical protein